MPDEKMVPTAHSDCVPGRKSSAATVPSGAGASDSIVIGSSSPSSHARTASAISMSTTSQKTLPVSTCARICARPPL